MTIDYDSFSLVTLLLPLSHVFAHTDRLQCLLHSCCFREIASLCERSMGSVISVISVINVINRITTRRLLLLKLFLLIDPIRWPPLTMTGIRRCRNVLPVGPSDLAGLLHLPCQRARRVRALLTGLAGVAWAPRRRCRL